MSEEQQEMQPAQREQAWDRLKTTNQSPINCRLCFTTSFDLVTGICKTCFLKGLDQVGDGRPFERKAAVPTCNYCGRAGDALRPGEGMLQGQSAGSAICGSCACTAAGCAGARDSAEARRMMASASLQAEAVTQSRAMMKRADEAATAGDTAKSLTLTEAAEHLAHIAFGDKS